MAKPGIFPPSSPSVERDGMRESPVVSPDLGSLRHGNGPDHYCGDGTTQALGIAHGGDVSALDAAAGEVVDASASINPLGPPAWFRQEIERSISALVHYPDPQCLMLRRVIAAHHHASIDQIVVGNGSSELLAWLPMLTSAQHWIVPIPSYGEYQRSAALAQRQLTTLAYGSPPEFTLDRAGLEQQLAEAAETPRLVILGHPNNPTGTLLDVPWFEGLRQRYAKTLFVVDEAFAEFCDDFRSSWCSDAENLIVLRSLTKSLAIPGLRLGYALASPSLAERFRQQLPPWSVNLLAQRVGVRAFADPEFATRMRAGIAPLKAQLLTGLRELPNCRVIDTPANWVLLELRSKTWRAREVAEHCRAQGIALRVGDDFRGLSGQWLRIAVRSAEENQRILAGLASALGGPSPVPPRRARRSIMLQGCSSDAGKSLLVTALCRCLAEDGYRVAPFKAQNMSNNSGVAADGGELGRAQVVQARACGIPPDTRMNPVLLKPTSDRGSQVVVRGHVFGQRDVYGYLGTRQYCLAAALEAYDSLAHDFDVIVCEGAGSAGEMNLRPHDIVNMGFVEQREMPVLLVGDINRGGVYASFVGHMEVMSELDRRHVRGFIVNQFRGDARLLEEAHQWVERHTQVPVLGVVPYLPDLRLPQEDRLSLDRSRQNYGAPGAPIQIAVVVPPHVSNATDIDPLLDEPDVQLRLVERAEDLANPDVVILLGTKSTIADLAHLRDTGLETAIIRAYCSGAQIVGICGGLQMLGEHIEDPNRVESSAMRVPGFGLLPVNTTFAGQKLVRPISARHLPSGTEVTGYEIHNGTTDFARTAALLLTADNTVLGGGTPDGRVWGTYVHGLFDSDAFRCWFLDALRAKKGLEPLGKRRIGFEHETTLHRLAQVFREHVDYGAILRLMGLT